VSPFPRPDYRELTRYGFDRTPVALDLSDNTNQWGTHPAALKVLRGADTNALARYPGLYADNLRIAAATRLGVPEPCIATGCGSDDVLDCAYRAAGGGPGDFVALASPTFSMAGPLARMNGMEARSVPWSDALVDPARLLEGGPSLVYVCRPNNPTGAVAPTEWVGELLSAAESLRGGATRRGRNGQEGSRSGGPLIVLDEAYVDFGGDTYADFAARIPGLLVTRTLSKAFGLAGLRIGYAVGTPETILEVEKARGPYKVSRVAAEAGAAALRDAEGWVERTVAECVANRRRTEEELARRGLEPIPSGANFVLFRAPTGDAHADASGIRERGVAARPFAAGMPDGGDGLRVTVAPWLLMERFFRALDGYRESRTTGPARREPTEEAGAPLFGDIR
jgi:histidinol-phosphate/aromatic aminotransferase/cobyric acid decarboxylase-like protein